MVNKIDKKVSIAIVSIFVILSVQYFLLIFLNTLEYGSSNTIQLSSKILVVILFISVFPLIIKYNFSKLLIVYTIFILVYFINFIVFPNNRDALIGNIFEMFFMSALILVYSLSINDLSVLRKTFKQGSNIIFISSLLTTLFIIFGKRQIGDYSMSLSYYTLIPALFYLDDFFSKFHFKPLILFLISLLIIVALGARGPLIPIIFYGAIKFIKSNSKGEFKFKIVKILITIITVLFILYFDEIIKISISILDEIGWSSRTLRLLLIDEISLSGREIIYNYAWSLITDRPLFGYGLLSDRVFFGSYVHNIFLEFSLHFGLIFGLGLFLVIIVVVIISYFKDKNNIILFLFSLSIIPLMFSGSYIIDMIFWILIGSCFRLICSKKQPEISIVK